MFVTHTFFLPVRFEPHKIEILFLPEVADELLSDLPQTPTKLYPTLPTMVVLRNGKNTTAAIKPTKPTKPQRTCVCDGLCYKKKQLVIDGTIWTDVDHYVGASWFYVPDSPQHMEYYNIIKTADGPNKIKLLVYQDKGGKYSKDWVINTETGKRKVNEVVKLYKHLQQREDWRYVHYEFLNKAYDAQFQNLCKKCQDDVKRNREFCQKISSSVNPVYICA